MNTRRRFLQQLTLTTVGASLIPKSTYARFYASRIYTVTGEIAPSELGVCLSHEHIMSNFGGEPGYNPHYDAPALKSQVLPYLKYLKSLGVNSILDCTTAYFGRDVALLKALSEESEIYLITNTGYYGAADDRYVPAHAYQESAEQIAERWIREFEQGIDGTSIRPGFIKIAADAGEVSDIDAKLMRAALKTQRSTGLTIACHTGNNPAVPKLALQLMEEEKVKPQTWIWTHAHQMETSEELIALARQGMWISLDGLRISEEDTIADQTVLNNHLQHLTKLKEANLLTQVLISHDGNSFPRGGAIRPYEAIFTHFLPLLKAQGFTQTEIEQLLVKNPQKAFIITS
ncbi:MAG: phosphotriesterase [Cyclobacteriaceae bacterium]